MANEEVRKRIDTLIAQGKIVEAADWLNDRGAQESDPAVARSYYRRTDRFGAYRS